MRSRIRIGFNDKARVFEEIERIYQSSEVLTTADVPTCGKGLRKGEVKQEFKSIQDRKMMAEYTAQMIGEVEPEKFVHLKIRWADKQMLDRATDFFDYVSPVYAEAYKYSHVFYSASSTGMDVIYESERPLWLAQLWVSWNMFLNKTQGTALR